MNKWDDACKKVKANSQSMSIQSISFFQQDQSYWQQAQAQSQASTADASLINVMGQAETNLAKGLASIANGEALTRVNTQLSAAIQSLLDPSGSSTSSSSSSTTPSPSSSSSVSAPVATPATGIGTARITASTSLSTLGILPNGTISVSAGINTTLYTSTGTDTVANLINAINIDLPTNANVTASINNSGQLVFTSRNNTDTITIGGSGTDAAVIGFGVGHNTFSPIQPPASSANTAGSSGSSGSSGAPAASPSSSSASSTSSTNNSQIAVDTLPGQQTFSTAASILSSSGVSGSLVDLLA